MDDPSRLVVMTANIGNDLADPLRVARQAVASGADVIGLQEVSQRQAEALLAALADILPFSVIQGHGIPGKAIFSRHPLTECEPVEIIAGRPDLLALLGAPEGVVRVVVAHPEPPRFGPGSIRRNTLSSDQIRRLAEVVYRSQEPGLLLGDLNRVSWQRAAKVLREMGMIDAWLEGGRGPGFTLPARWAGAAYRGNPLGKVSLPPLARVDYVWHTPHFRTEAAWLADASGSDHRPVVARLSRRLDGS
jgi:vancomycin resistance protein VanJ